MDLPTRVASAPPIPPAGPRTRLVSALAAVAVFCAVAAAVRAALPWPPAANPLLRRKLEAYDARGPATVAFFGSSVLYRGIDPDVVERRLATHGVQARVFNFAMPAMRAFETDELLRELVAHGRALPEWTVVELGDWDPRRSGSAFRRDVAWHTALQTSRAVRLSLALHADARDRWDVAGRHVRAWAMRAGSVGEGPCEAAALFGPETLDDAAAEFEALAGGRAAAAWHGHVPLRTDGTPPTPELARRRLTFVEGEEEYLARMRKLAATPRAELAPAAARAVEEQTRFLRAHGTRVVHLAGPGSRRAPTPPTGRDRPPFLAFDDPDAFPGLYATESRFDRGHLDASGAAAWSALVADRLACLLGRELR